MFIGLGATAQETQDNLTTTKEVNGNAIFVDGVGEIGPIFEDNIAYSLSKSLEKDYNFSIYNYNDSGDVTTNYYKIDLNYKNMTTNGNVTWEEVPEAGDDTIQVELPNNDVKYLKWKYTNDNNYAEASGRINNSVTSENVNHQLFQNISSGKGGAIYNSSKKDDINIVSDFIKNSGGGQGVFYGAGAIYVANNIGDIIGDFILNHSSTGAIEGYNNGGGAIYNYTASIGNIEGTFIKNDSYSQSSSQVQNTGGGVLYNRNAVDGFKGVFIGNYATIAGLKNNVSGDHAGGGVLYNRNTTAYIKEVSGVFIDNYVNSYKTISPYVGGGAIHNVAYAKIDNIYGDFINNHVINSGTNAHHSGGGAIYNGSSIKYISGNFINNYLSLGAGFPNSGGGAIYNTGNITDGIVNSNFIGNYSESSEIGTQGGAIWTSKDINIIANNGKSIFQGNYVQVGDGEKDYQAIWVEGADKKLNLQQINNGKMYMYDNINGTEGYSVNIQGDGTGTYHMLNDIYNANVIFDNTTINTVNNNVHSYNFDSLTLANNTNFIADVDLVNETMDRVSAENTTVSDGAKLIVSGMNLLNDAEKDNTKILFADENLSAHVDTTVSQVAYSPIFKYDVNYITDKDDKGYFTFERHTAGGNSYESYNPSVLASPVSTQAIAQVAMQNTFNYSFGHSDTFMQMPSVERVAIRNRNKYAISQKELTDGTNPLFQIQDTSSAWFKPYVSFENIPLKNGPKIDVVSYGSLAGYDTDLVEMKKGWVRNWTGFVGYNGANMNYSGVDSIQNGGLLGGTLSLYKGNFFNATTLSAGAMVGENTTMYGHENTTSLLAGIGNKTGYNVEFKDGRLTLQPSLFMSYSFVKTFDYTNAAGVKIDSDPLHSIQISPGVKLIANTKGGWQPYIGVNMVWNILNESDVSANSVTLPKMSVKPYVQYGLGVQKRIKDDFRVYAQAMINNGGRNGISLTAGFRWALGGAPKNKNNEKVQAQPKTKTVVKQLKSLDNQKANNIDGYNELIKSNTQSEQQNKTVIKQLSSVQQKHFENTSRTSKSAIISKV